MLSGKYFMGKAHALAILLLVIGGANLGLKAFTGQDAVTYLIGKGFVANLLFFCIGVSALCIALYRDSYLPFLGPTVLPCAILAAQTPKDADTEVRIFLAPGAKVIYWAAEPETKELQNIQNWKKAYLSFKNAGVAVADGEGFATLRVRKPQPYTVPLRQLSLSPHIHYRVCHDDGVLGRVQTITLDGKEYFENLEQPEAAQPEQPKDFVKVDSALAEINGVIAKTEARNLMVESGALESIQEKGAPLDAAF